MVAMAIINPNEVYRKPWAVLLALLLASFAPLSARAQTNQTAAAGIFSRPLSRADAIRIALRQNTAILKGQAELRASYGIEVQLRAIALPQLSAGGGYNAQESSLIESFPAPLSSVTVHRVARGSG